MRILVVDPEYLIAMDAERILNTALPCEVEIAMPRDYPAVLASRNFDVVLIDSSLVESPEEAQRLRAADAAIVFATSLTEEVVGLADWPDIAVVPKPFDDRQLVEAIRNAARIEPHPLV